MEKQEKGFRKMTPEQHRKIASMGGIAARESGNAHHFTPEEAREAGKKGGMKISQDKEFMSRIGKIGGKALRRKKNV